MNNARFEEAVREFLKAVKHKTCRNQGTNSYAAYYNIGVIYECLGEGEKAREYYGKCGVSNDNLLEISILQMVVLFLKD